MTIDELIVRPDFVTLAPQQKVFVREYCTNGADKTKASHAAYNCKDDQSALATAHRNLRHPAIKRLVADFYGQVDETPSKSAAVGIAWELAKSAKGDPKVVLDCLKWIGQVSGWEVEKQSAPTSSAPVEDDEDDAALLAAMKGD